METKSTEELHEQLDDALKEVERPTRAQRKVQVKKVANAERKLKKLKRSKYPLRRRLERLVKTHAKPFPAIDTIQEHVHEAVEAEYAGEDEVNSPWDNRIFSLEVDDVIDAYSPLIAHEQETGEEPTSEELEEVEALYDMKKEEAKALSDARLAVALDHATAWARAADKELFKTLRRAEENEAFADQDEAQRRASETVKGRKSIETALKELIERGSAMLDDLEDGKSGRLTEPAAS
jgi:hypothetical protein